MKIISYENNKISDLKSDQCEIRLIKIFTSLFELYGNRQVINEVILENIVYSVLDNYSHLGIDEIPRAFELWSQNKIEGSEPYGGEFNLLVVNRILSDYDKYRKKQRADLFEKINIIKKFKEEENITKANIEYFNSNVKTIIIEIAMKAKTWHDIHEWIYKRAEKEGMIDICIEERKEIFKRAVQEEIQELREELYFCKDKIRAKEIRNIIDNGEGTIRSKIIAGKMAIYEHRNNLKGC